MDPTGHTFRKLTEKNGVVIYYTNPNRAKTFTDTNDIINHYNNEISTVGNKRWVWIFDSDGFDLKQALDIQSGLGIAKVITGKCGNNLQEIKIINPTWHIKALISAVTPFLDKSTKEKIRVMGDRYYSVLEFI